MGPIGEDWRIFLALGAIAIGSTLFSGGKTWHSSLALVLIYAVHLGFAVLLGLTAALGRLPW